MWVGKELHMLLTMAHKVHPELQTLLIELMQHQPNLLVDECRITP